MSPPSSRPRPAHPLQRALHSGLHRVSASTADAACKAANACALRAWRLNLNSIADETTLLSAVAREMQFPAWFGHNRDALTDCLLDLSWSPAKGYVLVIDGLQQLLIRSPDAAHMLIEVLQHCADIWRGDSVPFWVLLSDKALPELPELTLEA